MSDIFDCLQQPDSTQTDEKPVSEAHKIPARRRRLGGPLARAAERIERREKKWREEHPPYQAGREAYETGDLIGEDAHLEARARNELARALDANGSPGRRRLKPYRLTMQQKDALANVLDSTSMGRIAQVYTGNGVELVLHAIRIMRDDVWVEGRTFDNDPPFMERVRVSVTEQQKAREWLQEVVNGGKAIERVEINHTGGVGVAVRPISVGDLSDDELESMYKTVKRLSADTNKVIDAAVASRFESEVEHRGSGNAEPSGDGTGEGTP